MTLSVPLRGSRHELPGAQRLDVFKLHLEHLLVEKNNRVKGLILGAGRNIVFGEGGEELLQLLFTRIMRRKFYNVVAITLEPGAVAALRGERKVFAPHDIGGFFNSGFCIHTKSLIYEPRFVY